MFGSAESEHPRLTDGEIISEEFQPMWSQSTNVTDRQTDDMRSQDRATKVHRAVNTTHDNSFVTVMKCMTEKMSHLRFSSALLLYDFFFVASIAKPSISVTQSQFFSVRFALAQPGVRLTNDVISVCLSISMWRQLCRHLSFDSTRYRLFRALCSISSFPFLATDSANSLFFVVTWSSTVHCCY